MTATTKRLASAIALTSILTLSGVGVSIHKASIQAMSAVAQTSSCDTKVRQENFSLRVGSSTGINLRSDRRLDARTNQNVAYNQIVDFDGWGYGQSVNDLWRGKPDALWFKLKGQDRWVPSAYMIGYPPSKPPIQPNCSGGGSGQINLPFGSGQTWYVCQGYQGTVTHHNSFAFDLTVAQDFGTSACWAGDGNVNKSAGRQVLAPAAGTVTYVGQDLVCLKMDSGHSLLIGHIDRSVPNGATVRKDGPLGTVSKASNANGGYAHIHVESRKSATCAPGTSVPFTAANGFQFSEIGDLPDLSSRNDYFKKALTRKY